VAHFIPRAYSTHHSVSEKHLPRYLGEFDYRYNTRKITDGERTEQTIQQTAGKRLRYKEPVTRAEKSGE
jgi:hypothetical protein